ncbi:GNAT family N-acetyltransferase [Paludicola sp. MB14-C6]|uniref:GNAT family N-acetyltransferase n=1 Tax=Paludihabitans sp. MB14-C6 TaxID=3070656 RepID=UPI0027DB06D9|nr:GNAT family N-acetyltransferase [Paludicola sp. MB14-C6]WMJ23437.1 GNAT family N-acetyltransferase [Paludicola sp. MB14-C6]
MSIEVKHPQPHNVLAMKKIWQTCFGDDMSYIDFFFERCFNPEHALVAYYDYKPVAMMFLLPTSLKISEKEYMGAYIYAVATKPDYRGMGIMKLMEQKAVEVSTSKGIKYLCLVPQTKSLYHMYEKIGYKTTFYVTQKKYMPLGTPNSSEIMIENCNKIEFTTLRKKFVHQLNSFVEFDNELQEYRFEEFVHTGIHILKVTTTKTVGYIVGYQEKDCFVVKETSLDKDDLTKAMNVLVQKFKVTFVKVRGQKGVIDEILPFGMYKSLSPEIDDIYVKAKNPYMNLMLDYFEGE